MDQDVQDTANSASGNVQDTALNDVGSPNVRPTGVLNDSMGMESQLGIDIVGEALQMTGKAVLSSPPFRIIIQHKMTLLVPHESDTQRSHYKYRLPSGSEFIVHISIDPTYRDFHQNDYWYSVDGWYGSNPFRYNYPHLLAFKTQMSFSGTTLHPATLLEKFIFYQPSQGEGVSQHSNPFPQPKLYLRLNLYERQPGDSTKPMVHAIKYLVGNVNPENYDTFIQKKQTTLHLEFQDPRIDNQIISDNKGCIDRYNQLSDEWISESLVKMEKAQDTIHTLEPVIQALQLEKYMLLERQKVMGGLVSTGTEGGDD
jgi:hypothetical protein